MQSVLNNSTFSFTDPEGYEIFVYRWGPPDGVPAKAVVQIEHGAAEHALRYERVAQRAQPTRICRLCRRPSRPLENCGHDG